ncbi:UNKNOWN [Stylonychia lemnae]|uniref:Uncharacterized protein n=1 Tax=Stylonychia lemnae TaxID=5949 RepID=A0A077ZWJ6_STYLE|nr:UNKNOWN [Stylonychia lemnae]|eukprot:CDW73657.1 UNKNOWN [Stylonychia lemnae]
MSSISLGASATGIGTTCLALAGATVVPFVGWTVAGVTVTTLVAKNCVDKTVLKSNQEEVEKEVKIVVDLMRQVQQIMGVLQKLKEIEEKSSSLKKLFVFLIIKAIKENADIQDSQLKQKVIEEYVKYKEKSLDHQILSTNISSAEEEFKFQEFGNQYFSSIGNNLSNGGIQILQLPQKVEYLTRNGKKIYQVSRIGFESIGELQTAQNLGGFASKAAGTDGIRLIGENTKAFRHIQRFNVDKVKALGGAAKVTQSLGIAFGVLGFAIETYSVFQFEADYNKNITKMDNFEKAINELKEKLPKILEFIFNFESQGLQHQEE